MFGHKLSEQGASEKAETIQHPAAGEIVRTEESRDRLSQTLY